MSWDTLRTDYKDIAWSGLKKYTQIDNDDGTVSFRDDTVYTNKEKSFFGSKEANAINEAINYIMTQLENGTDLYSEFQEFFKSQKQLFLDKLELIRQEGHSSLQDIEDEHKQRINSYETQQKMLFEIWFNAIKNQLSSDQAGNLQNQVDGLDVKTDGFVANEVVFSSDGKTITEKMGNKKIVTEFRSETEIIQKLYVNDVLSKTKTVTFIDGGEKIKEVIS